MYKWPLVVCTILFLAKCSSALEYNRQRINSNTDFLLHEGGIQTNNGGKRDYVAQFPALGPQVTTKSTSTTAVTNPSVPNNPQSSNGQRDYVAQPFPPLKPVKSNYPDPATSKSTTTTTTNNSGSQRYPQSPNGKRDYVAPQFPTLKPVQTNQPIQNNQQYENKQGAGNKVKDLVNLYESKTPNQGSSYSSNLQGNANKNNPSSSTRFTQSIPTATPIQPTKPMSFSSVVAGPNKVSTRVSQTITTAKPINIPNSPGSRPGMTVLPSSIVNNNRPTTTDNSNVSDGELQVLSEELLRKDTNNAARYITINYQEKTTSQSQDDRASQPLLTVSPEAWNIPTIQKFLPLLDNYEKDSLVNEHVTPQERIEENNFMDAVMSTTVMRHLMTFLKNKGLVSLDPKQQRDFVKQLWFTLYSRGKGKLGSSGFEHTFLSEVKNGGIQGLHNWIYFSKEEVANRVNYLGYMKYAELNDKGAVLKFHFTQQGLDKPVNAMFIGTSPELELALYTLCFVTRVDNDCNLKLGTKDVNIVTYNYRYRSKNLIGTAFPQI